MKKIVVFFAILFGTSMFILAHAGLKETMQMAASSTQPQQQTPQSQSNDQMQQQQQLQQQQQQLQNTTPGQEGYPTPNQGNSMSNPSNPGTNGTETR
jgi:hypothetical protein